jgi:hypothetical protein
VDVLRATVGWGVPGAVGAEPVVAFMALDAKETPSGVAARTKKEYVVSGLKPFATNETVAGEPVGAWIVASQCCATIVGLVWATSTI